MTEKKFDPKKLKKLNNPQRLEDIPPDFVCDRLNLVNKDVLVEIGAGTAFFSIAFVQHLKPSKLYACDISDVMIKWVEENVVPEFPEIVPVKTDENSVPLGDETGDLVFMIALHHELENPLLSIKEAYRILKPGGKIFIADWKKAEMNDGPPEHIRCLPENVKEQLEESEFKKVQIFNDLAKHFLITGEKSL